MRTPTKLTLNLAAAGLLATAMACGGSGGSSTETADITGTLDAPAATASIHASALDTGVTIVAVDETGNSADSATGVTGPFTLTVPTGHDYVLIVSDASGIISAIVYKDASDATASELAVVGGTAAIDLGTITVDATTRTVEVKDPASVTATHNDGSEKTGMPEPETRLMGTTDTDGDHIPDAVDTDKDNDGIENGRDRDPATGADMSTDMDNDGVDDSEDSDVDGDGIANALDVADDGADRSHDQDNDGVANDRDVDDDGDGTDDADDDDHPSHVMDGTTTGDATVGAAKFAACTGCHGTDGTGGTVDEDISDASAAKVADVLANGNDDGMPAFADLVDFAADLAAFLADPTAADTGSGSDTTDGGTGGGTGGGTTTTPGDATIGQTVYANCSGCHGATATGGFGPNVVGASEATLSNVLTNGKGSMPPFTSLVGNAADLAAYLATL